MKKGFTLIELLSVIVILAVITLIAIPIISGVTTKVRLNALKSSANGLMEASDLYYAQYSNTKTVRFDINNNKVSSNDTTNLLTYNGDVKEGTVIINKKGETTICLTDGKNSVYKNYRDQKVTEVANKKCTIPSSTYVVYLDNTATLNELSNQELTELVRSMQEEINTLKQEKANQSDLETTNSNLETVATVAGSLTLDKIYPIGSIYMSTIDDTPAKVAARFGGTWVVYGDGRFLKSSTDVSEKTGGSNSVTLTSSQIPSLTISGSSVSTTISTMSLTAQSAGAHTHTYSMFNGQGRNASHSSLVYVVYDTTTWPSTLYDTVNTSSNGSHTHSVTGSVTIPSLTVNSTYTNNSVEKVNVQNKYITVYMYKRTA